MSEAYEVADDAWLTTAVYQTKAFHVFYGSKSGWNMKKGNYYEGFQVSQYTRDRELRWLSERKNL